MVSFRPGKHAGDRVETGATAADAKATDSAAERAVTDERARDRSSYATSREARDDSAARDRFGGANWGAAFFGFIVAIGTAILLTSILGAIGAAVGSTTSVTQSQAEKQAGTIGIVAAAVLLVVLLVGYYAGGYVAGRMSRFDGGRQGFAVWVIGFAVTILAAILGAVFGSQYNILDRVSLPNVPVSLQDASIGGLVTALAVILGTLLAAVLGGKVGHRYHNKVDREVRW